MYVAIIGAGAAGCFAAINLKRLNPSVDVTVYESGNRPLAKVSVTGGGRCNLTNSFDGIKSLSAVYPRGERLMKRLLHEFSNKDTCEWFEREGVRLITQDDYCVFPQSQDAMEIVDTLINLMNKNKIKICTGHRVDNIEKNNTDEQNNDFRIKFSDTKIKDIKADAVVVAIGGSPHSKGLAFLDNFTLEIVEPRPSLFSFCLPQNSITEMTGTVVNEVEVSLSGTKHRASGPLLITHWGVSGPAILKLSSYAARSLFDNDYKAKLSVNWFGDKNENDVLEHFISTAKANPQKKLSTTRPEHINSRLWLNLLLQSGVDPEQRWCELSKKSYNRMVNTLTNNIYNIEGKNKFKEEFVTCGGIALNNVNSRTLECKTCPGLYFAGEVLDVDAITGGFNLQAAWTMGYVVAKSLSVK
ncbi:MAG: NAD(P)/FAD-dependent oxidoreductase [Prevotella sp.]|nr:NAD(P)/FAD-dependent oxidoreductase [Prevotella sp.]